MAAVGRPKVKGGRRAPVVAMLTPKQQHLAKQAAKAAGISLSAWLATLVRDHFMSEAREAK